MSEALDTLLTQVVNLIATKVMQSAVIEEGPDGSPVLGGFPPPSEIRDYVMARVDLSAFGGAPGNDGLTIGQIMQLLTPEERAAAAAVMLQQPDLFALFMEGLAMGARLTPGDGNFMALIDALVAYDVLTPERAGQLLGAAG